jgi:tetratricopeptide (TPR) repeat protein
VLLARGRFAEAERAALRAIELQPEDERGHSVLARILAACERYAPALAAVEAALRLDPDDGDAHRFRAFLLLHARPREWAVSALAAERALALDPEDADAQAVLGMLHLRAGRVAEGEARFRAALELDPTNTLALRGLAEALSGRHALYRPFLRYSTWMERASQGLRLAVVAGAWAVVSAAAPLLRGSAWAGVLTYTYLAFCAYTWFAAPVTRFLLARQYPWMRPLDV